MSQSDWPEEGRRPDNADRSGQRPPDDWSERPSGPPSGMSGGMKACIVLICVVGLCCLLCCGVVGFFGYSMVPKVSEAPADVEAARDQIAKIDLLPGFVPKSSAKIDNLFFAMSMVEYESPGHASLMMMQMHPKMGKGDDMMLPMRQQFEQKRVTHVSNVGPMQNAKIETKVLKIKGRDCSFTFTKSEPAAGRVPGPKAGGGNKKVAVAKKSDRDGKNGMVLINIDFDDTYKEADIVKMLESIQ
jgi:hypothetical protein